MDTCQCQRTLGPLWRVPLRQVFTSVPTVHSAKPPLDSLLNNCFSRPLAAQEQQAQQGHGQGQGQEECRGCGCGCGEERLELFARGLRSGWTCVGNEVIAQQEVDCGDGSVPAGAAPAECVSRFSFSEL